MSRKHQGRKVPESKMPETSWWGPRHTAPPHVWVAEFVDGTAIGRCKACPAELRVEVGETDDQIMLAPYVMNAGTGVLTDEVDWFCDQLFAEMQRRVETDERRRTLEEMDLGSISSA